MALIILQHYGSRTAEKEGFTGVIDNQQNICENLAMCVDFCTSSERLSDSCTVAQTNC